MPPIVHDFDWPDRFVTGTVGQPGERTFYLQARTGGRVVSVALEKGQSAALAERIDEVLDTLMAEDGNPFSVPRAAPQGLDDDEPLDQPIEEQFRAGPMSLGWDPSTAQLVIEAMPVVETPVPDEPVPDEPVPDEPVPDEPVPDEPVAEPAEMLLVRIPVGAARAFAARTRQVVAAGRPVCPRCGEPLDGADHRCPPADPATGEGR